MNQTDLFAPETLALHAGHSPDPTYGAGTHPVHFTTGYVFANTDHASSLFNLEQPGYIHSRLANPTNAILEERIAALEGGIAALAVASGQAALHLAITTLMGSDSHIVASRSIDGGAYNLLAYTLPRFGIHTSFVNPRDPSAWQAAVRPETRLFFGESIGSSNLDVLNIPALSAIAHKHHIPFLVDATLATPVLQRPLDLGADIIIHAATQYLGGHGIAIGGILIDGGRFDWDASGLFPTLTEPYAGFHNTVYTQVSPVAAFILRAEREGLPDFGACLSPMNAFQILQGLQTLPLRMQAHSNNALALASHLNEHPLVSKVYYPGLANHPDYMLAQQLLPHGCGGLLSFDLKGGAEAAHAFIDALRLFSHMATLGDTRSLVLHPATTTHYHLSPEHQAATGITPGTVRLSVGIEAAMDLLADIERGLYAAGKLTRG